jgi:uncharacterized membrane protein
LTPQGQGATLTGRLNQLSREDDQVSIADILGRVILIFYLAGPLPEALAIEVPVDLEGHKQPFWKQSDVYQTITDRRALAVSAKIDKIGNSAGGTDHERLQVVAAGHVSAPLEYAWKKVRDFERLPKISSHFNKAVYTASDKKLYIDVEALGYHAHMYLQLSFHESAGWKEIRWATVDGAFRGMSGTIRLEDYKNRKTEMSLFSEHETKKLPLPPALKAFVIEVVSQRVAGLFREYIEDEYKKENKK